MLPRTMFGRSLLIVVVPLILLQAIATWVFYDRHWAAVSWRLSAGGCRRHRPVGRCAEARRFAEPKLARLLERAKAQTDLDFTIGRSKTLPLSIARDRQARRRPAQPGDTGPGRASPYRIDLLDDRRYPRSRFSCLKACCRSGCRANGCTARQPTSSSCGWSGRRWSCWPWRRFFCAIR